MLCLYLVTKIVFILLFKRNLAVFTQVIKKNSQI